MIQNLFIKYLLYANHWSKGFINIFLFKPDNYFKSLLLFLF